MKWKPAIDKEGIAQPAIESDCKTWRISRALVEFKYRYALHKHGGEALEFSDNADELKRMASNHGETE